MADQDDTLTTIPWTADPRYGPGHPEYAKHGDRHPTLNVDDPVDLPAETIAAFEASRNDEVIPVKCSECSLEQEVRRPLDHKHDLYWQCRNRQCQHLNTEPGKLGSMVPNSRSGVVGASQLSDSDAGSGSDLHT